MDALKDFKKDFNKDLIKRYMNTWIINYKFTKIHEFCNGDINKFIFLLRKGVYPYEYMDSWKRFYETTLSDKKEFISSLNMEDITDVGYRHAKRVFKKFNNKYLGHYHDFYVQSDALFFAEILEIFTSKCMTLTLLIFYHYHDYHGKLL